MELNNEEKVAIVTQHIKSISSNIYNLQVSLIAENAVTPARQESLDSLNAQLAVENNKLAALESELSSLNG